MKAYLASRYSRYQEMQQVRDELEKLGHTITSRWIDGDKDLSDSENERIKLALRDMEDLYNADTVISFTEELLSTNLRSKRSRGGRHIEHGIAIGLCKRTVVVGPRENIYHCLPSVLWFSNYSSFIDGFSEDALGSLTFGVQQIEKPDELL